MTDALTLAFELCFAVVFGVQAVRAFRRPTGPRVRLVAFFGVVVAILVVAALQRLLAPAHAALFRAAITAGLAALAFALLRLVDELTPVARATQRFAVGALAALVVALAARGDVDPPLRIAVTAYVVLLCASAVRLLVARSIGTHAVTERRLQAAALGTGILALIIVVVAVRELAADTSDASRLIVLALGTVGALSYLIAFVPPAWLRHIWQEPELRRFVERAPVLAAIGDDTALLADLEWRARASAGATGASIGLWDEHEERLVYRANPAVSALPLEATIAGRAFRDGHPILSIDPLADAPAVAAELERSGVRSVLAIPISSGTRRIGVLRLTGTRASLFADDDIALGRMLADQIALLLENRSLISETRRSNRHLRALIDSALDAVITLDASGRTTDWNRQAEVLLGWRRDEALGRPLADTIVPERWRAGFVERISAGRDPQGEAPLEIDVRHRDGHEFPVELQLSGFDAERGRTSTVFLRDISARRQAQLERERRMHFDSLTGFPNATLMDERIDGLIVSATPFALVLLDLAEFDAVNETLGHAAGDELLRRVAERLGQALGAEDTVARLRGDHFAAVLPHADAAAAERHASALQKQLYRPIAVADEEVEIAAHIGFAVFPRDASSASELMRRADIAMREAKRSARPFVAYRSDLEAAAGPRIAMRSELRRALDLDQLSLRYQPIVSIRSRTVARVEALARWEHPERGPIDPAEFIPVAERTGLIEPLTDWALRTALRDLRVWRATDPRLRVAVNISPRSFADPGLVGRIAAALREAEVPPDGLGLEVTETILMHDPAGARRTIERLRAMGVYLDLDDFGTGYSSLAYLQRLPFDSLKIDRQFVGNVNTDPNSATIVRATIGLSHELGFEVVGEGIEDQATWDQLAALGCDLAQGYFVARPALAAEFEVWLSGWQAGVKAAAATRSKRPSDQAAAESPGPRILVVDDDQSIVSVIRYVLEEEGYEVRTAANGEEALRSLERERPSLVLLDIHMPMLDGAALARVMRDRRMRVPIVVMTAGPAAARWAEQIGADAFLAKPFDVPNLLDITKRFVGAEPAVN